jgi:hypothetical protein
MELFTEDCSYESIQCAYGWDNVRNLFKVKMEKTRRERGTKDGYHIMSNLTVEGDGDRATALSQFIWVACSINSPPIKTATDEIYALRLSWEAGQPQIILAGYYVDELRKVSGRWRFVNRKAKERPNMDAIPSITQ